MAVGVPATAGAQDMVAATGTVEAAGTTAGVAITVVATAIAHRPKARDPEAAMVPAPVAAGMAIPAVVEVDHVQGHGPADPAATTVKTAVLVVVATADREAATAE